MDEENKNVPQEEQAAPEETKKKKSKKNAAPAEEAVVEHAPMLAPEQIHREIKPLSSNAFLAFWQKIWRWWLGVWYGFSDRHPKLSKILYMVFFFIVFSEGVTIWQYIVMTFLPFAFGNANVSLDANGLLSGGGLWAQPFVWPAVALGSWTDAAGNPLNYAIFNEPVKFIVNMPVYAEDGITITGHTVETLLVSSTEKLTELISQYGTTYFAVDKAGQFTGEALQSLQCAGLGNFIAFEIAVFTAQCINFPLQRNITYRSKGNPYYQAMWYFIGWVLISIVTNAVWGIINPLLMLWNWNEALIGLIKTFITGGLSMLVFFFIFMIIFPNVDKVAKNARAKADKAKANGASAETLAPIEAKAKKAEETALEYNTRCARAKAISLANTRAVSYEAAVKNLERAKVAEQEASAKAAAADEKSKAKAEEAAAKAKATLEACEKRVPEYQQRASDAIDAKVKAMEAYVVALDEIIAAKTVRGEDVTKVLKSQSKLKKADQKATNNVA